MKLNLLDFITDLERATQYLEYAKEVIGNLGEDCSNVLADNKDNEYLNKAIERLDNCELAIDDAIAEIKDLLELWN